MVFFLCRPLTPLRLIKPLRPGIRFHRTALMKRWRYALVAYLREALRRGLLASDHTPQALRSLLTAQYERWWSVDVQPCASKEHFLRYAGRYVRRPPLAQYRILAQAPDEVSFRTLDHKLKREVITRYTPSHLIDLLAEHIPDDYKHAIGHFGLLSPRSRFRTFGALFAQLGEVRRPKPQRLSWAKSVEREYGENPLLDSNRDRMMWISRIPPSLTNSARTSRG